jgi:hypothetical protein
MARWFHANSLLGGRCTAPKQKLDENPLFALMVFMRFSCNPLPLWILRFGMFYACISMLA